MRNSCPFRARICFLNSALKENDFAREPGAAPNFAGIQAMFDVYTDTKMIDKKLDAKALKHPTIVAPIE